MGGVGAFVRVEGGGRKPDPGFDIPDDERKYMVRNYHRTDVCRNVSISAGNDMACLACGPRHSYREGITAGDPQVVILTDQFFPPKLDSCLGNCPLIIRVEDGLLSEIEGTFFDYWKEFLKPLGSLPMGSVILIGSMSHLGTRGLSNYTEDLVWVVGSLGARVGQGVEVVPLVSVPIGGFGGGGGLATLSTWTPG